MPISEIPQGPRPKKAYMQEDDDAAKLNLLGAYDESIKTNNAGSKAYQRYKNSRNDLGIFNNSKSVADDESFTDNQKKFAKSKKKVTSVLKLPPL